MIKDLKAQKRAIKSEFVATPAKKKQLIKKLKDINKKQDRVVNVLKVVEQSKERLHKEMLK